MLGTGNEKKLRFCLYIILFVCFMLRLALGIMNADKPLTSDALLYSTIGHNLASGNGFVHGSIPTAYGNFLYPFILSLLYRLFGDGNLSIYIFQALIDTLSCYLVFRLAYQLTKSAVPGIIAASIYAFYPPFILSSGLVLTETVSILLTLLVTYILFGNSENPETRRFVWAGVACGLLTLIRPAMLLYPVFIFSLLAIYRRRFDRVLPKAALLVAVSYLVVIPWTIRNYVLLHAFVPVSTHSGLTVWAGTIKSSGGVIGSPSDPVYSIDAEKPDDPLAVKISARDMEQTKMLRRQVIGLSEVEADALYKKTAVSNIKRDPVRYAGLAVPKVLRMWFHLWPGCQPSMENYIVAMMNLCLIILAMLGSWKLRGGWCFKASTLLLACYLSLVVSAAVGVVRYSYPIFPLIIVLAAYGMYRVVILKNTEHNEEQDLRPVEHEQVV